MSLLIILFKVKLIQNYNFFIAVLASTNIIFTLTFLLYRKELYPTSLRQMVKHRTTLNCLPELLLFPAVIVLKLFLSFAWPSRQNCVTSHASFQLFTSATFLEFNVKVVSFKCNDNFPFCFSWYFAKSWYYTKFFFWLWASIYC